MAQERVPGCGSPIPAIYRFHGQKLCNRSRLRNENADLGSDEIPHAPRSAPLYSDKHPFLCVHFLSGIKLFQFQGNFPFSKHTHQ